MNTSELTTIISFIFFVALVFFFAIALAVRYRKRAREHDALKAQMAAERLRAEAEIREETLQYISRELHDNLAHTASLIKINLTTISLLEPRYTEKLAETTELARELISNIKHLSVRLSHDPVQQASFMAAVEKETERLNNTGIFTARLVAGGNIPDITNDKAVILYRMMQECLNNIIKHSGAKNIAISIAYINKSINLVISDDGKGFDTEEHSKKDGSGLNNLKHRAYLLNATLHINSKPGHGTTTTIYMPYDQPVQ